MLMHRLRCPYCHKPSGSLGALLLHITKTHKTKAKQIRKVSAALKSKPGGLEP